MKLEQRVDDLYENMRELRVDDLYEMIHELQVVNQELQNEMEVLKKVVDIRHIETYGFTLKDREVWSSQNSSS